MSYQGTAILGRSSAQKSQMIAYVTAVNAAAPVIAHLYLELGPQLGVRGDLAYAQAILETNYFRYGGIVRPEQNNYAGIGATDPSHPAASFATPEEGVMAHLQHLYAYATTAPLPDGITRVDPRFDLVARGSAPYVGALNGRWAVPGTGYGEAIDRILGEILTLPLAGEPYQITKAYLDTSSQNRPGACDGARCWEGVKGIVVHRTADPNARAMAIRNYFNSAPDGRFASSQFVLDDTSILQLMPIGEVAFHTAGKNQSYLGIETCEYNWGASTWQETYRRLVWLTAYLARVYGLTPAQITGHFWWDPINRPFDPTHLTWTPAEGPARGLFDWNQFVVDVAMQMAPQPPAATAPEVIGVQVVQPVECTRGFLIDSTTYVPIRAYTACVAPDATVRWDDSDPAQKRVVVELPPAPAEVRPAAVTVAGAESQDAPAGGPTSLIQRIWRLLKGG